MATEIHGRSIAQQVEDDLIDLHTFLDKELNKMIPSSSLFPNGECRRRAFEWFRKLDAAIASPEGFEPIIRSLPYSRTLNPAWYIRDLLLRR